MAALSAGSLTYTVANNRRLGNSKVLNTIKIQITGAATSSTYPTGGIALTNGSMGVPNSLEALDLTDIGTTGYTVLWNSTSNKIQLFVNAATAGSAAQVEVASSVTPGAMTLYCNVIGW